MLYAKQLILVTISDTFCCATLLISQNHKTFCKTRFFLGTRFPSSPTICSVVIDPPPSPLVLTSYLHDSLCSDSSHIIPLFCTVYCSIIFNSCYNILLCTTTITHYYIVRNKLQYPPSSLNQTVS